MNGGSFAGAGLLAAASRRRRARTRRGAIGLALALVIGGAVAGGVLACRDETRSLRAVEAARSEHAVLRARHEILRAESDLLEAHLALSVERERSLRSAGDQGRR